MTGDAEVVIKTVNSLTANGGGDCPELGMTGLYQALLHCLPEIIIYYFSDADVKDEWRKKRSRLPCQGKESEDQLHFKRSM